MVKIQYNRPNVHTHGQFRIVPGLNMLKMTDDELKEFKAHPVIKEKIKKGHITIQGDDAAVRSEAEIEVSNEDPSEEHATGGKEDRVDARKAAEIIADLPDVNDIAYLRALSLDDRKTVSAAAKSRLEEIEQATNSENGQEDVE